MGANVSKQKSVSEIVNDITSNTLLENSSSCDAEGAFKQQLDISSISAAGDITVDGLTQESTATINFNCLSDQSSQNKIAKEISSGISSALDQKLSGISFANQADQNIVNKSRNVITNETNIKNIASCASKMAQENKISIKDLDAGGNVTLKNINQKLIGKVAADCTNSQKTLADEIAKLDAKVASSGTQASTGFDPIGAITGMFSSLGTMGMTALGGGSFLSCCCCIVVIVMIGYFMFKGDNTPTPAALPTTVPAPMSMPSYVNPMQYAPQQVPMQFAQQMPMYVTQ